MIQRQPKRITGFMAIAKGVIARNPGLTAQEVFKRAEQLAKSKGIEISASGNPESSLVATLHKYHRQYKLERRMLGGQYRYYSDDAPKVGSPPADSTRVNLVPEKGCCEAIPIEDKRRVQALVDLGKFSDKHEAHRSLIKFGLDALISKL